MRAISVLLLAAAVACGGSNGGDGDGGTDPGSPHLVAGGGVTGGAIAGTLNVYVIASDTGLPIQGATVHVATDATTDAGGLATVTGVTGAQTVSATASGYAATTWIGVAGASVTLPMQPAAPVPTATVSGTLSLPAPALGHYTLAVVLYSFLDDPSAPENSIVQPTANDVPKNACVRTTGGASCTWELTARIGKQLHTAVIVDGDPHGTASDTSDDTYTLIGYAVGTPMTLTAGQQVSGETLASVTDLTNLAITMPAAPSGLANVAAVPELALGDAGRIVFPLPVIGGTGGTAHVLAPTGSLTGTYEVVSIATPSATAKAPFSSTFAHGVSTSATLPAWLAPATPSFASGMVSFGAISGAAFTTLQLTQGTSVLWNLMVLDGSTSIALPALTADPLAGKTGAIAAALSAADVPGFTAGEFTIPASKTKLVRASGGQTTFTR